MDGVSISTPISLRDRLLISAKNRREGIQQLQFTVLMKALLLDKSSAQNVSDFNDTVQQLRELTSNVKTRKNKTPDDVKNIMKDFNLNFPKLKEKKIKNFKRAD